MTSIYRIEQTATAVILFDGEASDESDAMDKMARDAGYADYASIPAEIGSGDTLLVTQIS